MIETNVRAAGMLCSSGAGRHTANTIRPQTIRAFLHEAFCLGVVGISFRMFKKAMSAGFVGDFFSDV